MTFCQYNILSVIFCPVTFSPATLVGMQPSCSRPDKMGYVHSQYRKFKQWSLVRTVSVWLVCGRSSIDGLPVIGFIASRSDGWFFCWYRSFGRIYGRWLACQLVCLLSSLSVGWAIRPACYIQPITVWPANHPSIYLIANQPTKDCRYFYQRLHQSSAWISGIWGLTSPRFCSAGWLRWGYLTHARKSLAKFGAYFI